jgi:tellurium resistance protein TerZ
VQYSGSIIHSGDVIDSEKKSGKHTIKVDLSKLPLHIKSMYFTISAWQTTLKDILSPYVMFIDPETKQELCSYYFENKDTGNNTAVIMAKMSREKVGGSWKVLAVGHLGMGRADAYGAIQNDIAKYWANK